MIQVWTLLGLLGICSIEDVRKKEIQVYVVLTFGIVGVILRLFYQNVTMKNMIFGMAIGVVMMLVSLVTSGQIGLGDGLLLTVTGIFLGAYGNAMLFLHGLLFAAVWSLVVLLIFRRGRKTKIPFVPFLLIAYLEMLVL